MFAMVAAALTVQQFATDRIDSRIRDVDAVVSFDRFVNYLANGSHDRFVPNPKFWGKDIDLTCASPWNNGGGSTRAGTLISKRHIVFAKHFPLWNGVRIVFVDGDGALCPCYIEATKAIANSDIMVGLLDAEVTPNIHPAKILPPNAEKYIGRGEGLPTITFNQQERLYLNTLGAMPTNGSPWRGIGSWKPKDNPNWMRFSRKLTIGDSGNPCFLLIGNEPILIYCLYGGGAGGGPAVHLYAEEIQAAMDELCPGYKLECFDFSAIRK